MEEEEIWVPIRGHEDYEISNLGRLRNVNYRGTGKTRYKKPQKTNEVQINTNKDGVYNIRLHRLVAEYFVQNPHPEEYRIVEFKDGNMHNCAADNLYWTKKRHTRLKQLTSEQESLWEKRLKILRRIDNQIVNELRASKKYKCF